MKIIFYVFELYFFKFEYFVKCFLNLFLNFFRTIFFQNFFLKIKIMFETVLKKKNFKNIYIYIYLFIYLFIYQNLNFYIPKTLLHFSTLNFKSKLVNPKGIDVFYPSLKLRIKMVSVNKKSGTMNVVLWQFPQNFKVN